MRQPTGEQGRGLGGTTSRATAWLAWSLVALSVTLLLGGTLLSRAASSAVPDLSFVGETDDASVVNAIGWLFCGVGVAVGLNSFAGDFAEFWLTSDFGVSSLGEMAAWLSSWLWFLLVFVPLSLLLLLFPDGRLLPSPRWRPVA
jgi:hypothetical protein